jgi:hypothetical protein
MRVQHPETNTVMVSARDDDEGDGNDDDRTVLLVSTRTSSPVPTRRPESPRRNCSAAPPETRRFLHLLGRRAVLAVSFAVLAAVETRTTISVLLASAIVVFAAAAAVAAHLVARSDPPVGRLVRARTAPGAGPLEVRAVVKVEQRRLRLRDIRGAGAGGRVRRRIVRRIVVHRVVRRVWIVVRCCPTVPFASIKRAGIVDG